MEKEVKELYLDDIIPNRFQPRENFDENALKELAISIKEHGVIQPIIVRQIGEKYEIIAGERRYKASTMVGLTKIPAIISNLDDKESSKVALIENLQRRDLTPIEEARTYQKILELDALTQEDLAKTMGKSQSAISNKMRLLSLTDEVQDALLHEQISERHARSLLNISDSTKQVEMLKRIIESKMTVRELDEAIKNMNQGISGDNLNNNVETSPTTVNLDEIINDSKDINTNNSTTIDIDSLLRPAVMPTETIDVSSNLENNDPINMNSSAPEIISTNLINESDSINNNSSPNNDSLSVPSLYSNIEPSQTNNLDINSSNESLNQTDLKDTDIISNPPVNEIGKSIEKVKETVNSIKNSGSKVEMEEFDFEDFYQIVIRIDK